MIKLSVILVIFAALCSIVSGQGIVNVIERELIDSKHDYWVIYGEFAAQLLAPIRIRLFS